MLSESPEKRAKLERDRVDDLRLKVFCLTLGRMPRRDGEDLGWQQGVAFLMGNIPVPPEEFHETLRGFDGFTDADRRFLVGKGLRTEDGLNEPLSPLLHSIIDFMRQQRWYHEPIGQFIRRMHAEEAQERQEVAV